MAAVDLLHVSDTISRIFDIEVVGFASMIFLSDDASVSNTDTARIWYQSLYQIRRPVLSPVIFPVCMNRILRNMLASMYKHIRA